MSVLTGEGARDSVLMLGPVSIIVACILANNDCASARSSFFLSFNLRSNGSNDDSGDDAGSSFGCCIQYESTPVNPTMSIDSTAHSELQNFADIGETAATAVASVDITSLKPIDASVICFTSNNELKATLSATNSTSSRASRAELWKAKITNARVRKSEMITPV